MNDYRVDRADSKRTPCGMNSIMWIGNSEHQARVAFEMTEPGKDAWGKESATYGVILSRWSYAEGDYIVIASKFPTVN